MSTLNDNMEVKYVIIDVGLGVKQIKKCICYKNTNTKYKCISIVGEQGIYYANTKYLFDSEEEALKYLEGEL